MDSHSRIESLRIALEMERRGKNLYERALLVTEDPELRALLKELAADETKHHAQFSAMMEVFGLPNLTPEENELAAAKAGDFFFPGGLMQASMDGALRSPQAMLREAIRAERDSISFYGQLLGYVDDLDQQEIILRIIREEMVHLRTLTDKFRPYQGEEET